MTTGVNVTCADILGAAPIAPFNAYDVMIADPPYSERVHAKATSQSAKGGARHRDLGFDSLTPTLRARIAGIAAGVKRWSLIYTDVEGLSAWIDACESAGATYIRTIPWVRWSMPQLSGDRPPQGFECIALFWGTQRGRKSWNGPGNLTHLAHKAMRGAAKHKCEKPLGQALDLVSWFSNAGERIIDPCAGSGVMPLAARLLGRACDAFEIDATWAERARLRACGDDLNNERDRANYTAGAAQQRGTREDGRVHGQDPRERRAMSDIATASVVERPANAWVLCSSYNPALVDICKTTPGLRWNPSGRVWLGYRDAMMVLATRAARVGIDVRVAHRPEIPPPTFEAFPTLRPYQREGATFLLQRGREGALLGDAMGLGKTLQTLAAASHVGRLLIVCPSYVRNVWTAEIAKWHASRAVYLPQGVTSKAVRGIAPDVNTVVIHYDILHAWAGEIAAWLGNDPSSAVAFDEAHMLQNETTKRAKAARECAKAAHYRWALTGTPLTNRPKDLWNTVDVISPGRLGSFFAYAMRHCDAHQEQVTPEKVVWVFKGQSNLDELRERSREFMLRRTVQDVGIQLPPKTRQIVYLDVGKAAKVTSTLDAGGINGGATLRRALDVISDHKLQPVTEMLIEHLDAGAKVVCFTWRREVAEMLADRARQAGHASECVHGGVSHARRGLAIGRAKTAEGGVLVATIDAASTGVDFTFAQVCLFAEIDYKPHALLQAEARVHRFGQTSPTLIQYALGRGTIDEVIAARVIEKLDTFAAAIGDTGETLASDLRGNEDDIFAELTAAIEAGKA